MKKTAGENLQKTFRNGRLGGWQTGLEVGCMLAVHASLHAFKEKMK
jgi:hypothetical protein